METRTKIIFTVLVALVPASFCGCCCLTGMLRGDQAAADREAIMTARTACVEPYVFRVRSGWSPLRPESWDCVTAVAIVAEQAAAEAAIANAAAAAAAAAEAQRAAAADQAAADAAAQAAVGAARSECSAPRVFRLRPSADPNSVGSWDCVSPEMMRAEEEQQRAALRAAERAQQLAAEAAAAERERVAKAAEAARIAALPPEVTACEVQRAYQANEIAADARYPEGRRMIVTGRVESVSETWGTMNIRPQRCVLASVQLADDQRAIAGSLSRGASVAADCNMGHFVMGATWTNCRILR